MNTTENTTIHEDQIPTPEGQITQADIDRAEQEKAESSDTNK